MNKQDWGRVANGSTNGNDPQLDSRVSTNPELSLDTNESVLNEIQLPREVLIGKRTDIVLQENDLSMTQINFPCTRYTQIEMSVRPTRDCFFEL